MTQTSRPTIENYFVWNKLDFDKGNLGDYNVVESYHPESAAATEAFALALRSYCQQPDHDYTSCTDYEQVCLVVSRWPDGREADEYWFRVDTQMVRITEKEANHG